MPSGARISANPPAVARTPREANGLLRQASRMTMLSLVPASFHLLSTRLASTIWKSRSRGAVGLASTGTSQLTPFTCMPWPE